MNKHRRTALDAAQATVEAVSVIVKESPDITGLPIQLQVLIQMVALGQVISKLPKDQRQGAVAASVDGLRYIVEHLCGEMVLQ